MLGMAQSPGGVDRGLLGECQSTLILQPLRAPTTSKRRRVSDAAVAAYWLSHDSAEEIAWSKPGVRIEFDSEVERPTRPVTVTLRIPRRLLQELKLLARDRDVPYQSLMKVLLAEKVAELRRRAS
jgi:CopG antitoxin of type II toxin-antitoxin system